MKVTKAVRSKARTLKKQAYILYLASRDKRTPWYAKAFILAVAGYALSPVDLIPDFIPVLGYLDDLIILPACLLIAVKMIPANIYEDCKIRAEMHSA